MKKRQAIESDDDDDEPEALLVTNYYFEDERNEPISVHVLPVQWTKDKRQEGMKEQKIYLRGTADNGLQAVYQTVIAWRFDIFSVKPVISVLAIGNKWIVLQRPRKSFEEIIRPILVTVHCLSYAIRNPECSAKSMWEYLVTEYSLFEVRPSQNDLVEHIPLISEAVKWEVALAKSKFIVDFLEEDPSKKTVSDEDIQARKKRRLSNDDLFDNVCVFCDNGGDLLCCEGRCLRSFHATVKDGKDFNCESLGLTQDEVDGIRKLDFYCKNCQYNRHQCYACGKLGSSDKSLGAEVFPCSSAMCGHFYHPRCIAKLIYHETGVSDEEFEKRIMLGESFACPIHKCCECKQGEDKKDPELQFAVCRRCPTSYHRKCLPRDIHFENDDEDMEIRAWEGLLPDRVLIYCTKHEIVKTFQTPRRDHVKFPGVNDKKPAAMKNTFCQEKRRRSTSECQVVGDKFVSERKLEGRIASATVKHKMASAAKIGKHTIPKSAIDNPCSRTLSSLSALDSAKISRLDALITHAATSITLDDVTKKYRVSSTHLPSNRTAVEKKMTLGKVEHSAEKKVSIDHFTRYLPFGCHFIKVEVLEQIAEKLHPYIRNGDTILDFCCGFNEFSVIMKKKLEETGKKCNYKNYGIILPKHDFNFEQRDWMTVQRKELPMLGSRLVIIGLNPPFGDEGYHANQYINKALELNPGIVILVAPPKVQRLNEKKIPCDLIWEDECCLSGKPFYLPESESESGLIDVNVKQMELWNMKPPPLSLWSRQVLSPKLKAIAQEQGHISGSEGFGNETPETNYRLTGSHSVPRDLKIREDDTKEHEDVSSKSSIESSLVQWRKKVHETLGRL